MLRASDILFSTFFLLLVVNAQDQQNIHSNILTQQNFHKYIVQEKSVYKLVKFFVPSCGKCIEQRKVVENLMKLKDWSFKIYEFNCERNMQFCMKHIKSHPTLKVFNENGVDSGISVQGFFSEQALRPFFDDIQEMDDEVARRNNLRAQTDKGIFDQESNPNIQHCQSDNLQQSSWFTLPNIIKCLVCLAGVLLSILYLRKIDIDQNTSKSSEEAADNPQNEDSRLLNTKGKQETNL